MDEKVYRPGGAGTVVFSVCGLSIAVGMVVSVVGVLGSDRSRSSSDWAAEAPVALVLVGLSLLIVWMVIRSWTARLVLSADALEARQVFSTKVIDRGDVLTADVLPSGGFTPSASVRLQLADGNAERIQIPGKYITNAGAAELACAIQDWASRA